jgi:hypothetical protein
MDYEKDIRIQPEQLDIEWLEQPRLMYKYAKISAEASRDWDSAKERLALVRAQLDKAIRDNPDTYKIDKVTEGAIASTILQQEEYQFASEELIQAQFDFNIARAAVSALEHRKASLENLVRLYGQQYFAGPKIPRDLNAEWQQKQNQREANKKIKIRRRQTE